MGTAADLAEALIQQMRDSGPISVADYMEAANGFYYASHDPFGVKGDFITAPEISQMFGELIGLWCADLWDRAGRPEVAWVELGPGRGTLAADARRAMAKAGFDPRAALSLWKSMSAAMRGKAAPPEFLSDHPADDTRLDSIVKSITPALVTFNQAREAGKRPKCQAWNGGTSDSR